MKLNNVIKMYINGFSQEEIANHYNCGSSTIGYLFSKNNINTKDLLKKRYNQELHTKSQKGHLIQMLPKEKYENGHTYNWYECECGWKFKTHRKNIKRHLRRNNDIYICPTNRSSTKWNYKMVKKYFRDNNCKLLSTNYESTSQILKYRCECGNVATISFNAFKSQNQRCWECGLKKRAKSQRYNYEYVRKYFQKNNCKLLSTEYMNIDQKLDYICECGNKSKISFWNFKNGQRCGCKKKEAGLKRRGKNHHNWNPERESEDRIKERKYPEYKKWRINIFERDEFTCKICGDDKGGNLIAHHIFSYSDYPELRIDLNNGITLCEECHVSFHQKYGYGDNTGSQFLSFLSDIRGENNAR